MYKQYTRIRRARRNKKPLVLVLVLVVALVGFGFVAWRLIKQQDQQPAQQTAQAENSEQQKPKASAKTETKPAPVNLQPTIDSWVAAQSADFGIVIYDVSNKKVIAQHQPDEQYFAASLYKIYVAYLALVDFQDGVQDPDENLWGDYTRKECVDLMIRESHSPCGEAMMASMGQDELRARVAEMGIKNTTFAGIETTARDSALILQYIAEGRDLNAANTEFLKDAMRVQEQRFRNGLAKGAPEAIWETKVGWNEEYNYHDIGIMNLQDGRTFSVAILSYNNGSSEPIADFAATIYRALQ